MCFKCKGKNMSKTKIMMIALVPSLLFICLYVLLFYDPFSNCPMAFRFEFETKCWLKDERVGVKLIELYNADTNGFWLAKVAERVVWLEHPHDHMSSYKKHIPE